MFSALLLGVSLFTAAPADNPAAAADRAAYEEARAKAGRDPQAHIRLALWCEAHGLAAERIKHLALAVLNDPANARARGLLGLVAYAGRWQRPEAVADTVRADAALTATLDQYQEKRARTPSTADAQWKLALWCAEHGLKTEETAHLVAVTRLDPGREAAWKRLGYQKQGGRWATPAQLIEEKAEASRQKQADHHWRPLMERWRSELDGKNQNRREAARAALAEVTDPRALPTVWSVFARGNASSQIVAVQLLGQIDSMPASQALALLALASPSAEVRRHATETLRRRDPREYSGALVGLMRKPIKYTYTPVPGPGQTGTLTIEGERVNTQRRYTPPRPPDLNRLPSGVWSTDANGLPAFFQKNATGFGYVAPDGSYALAGGFASIVAAYSHPQPPAFFNQMIQNPAHAAQIAAANQGQGYPSTVLRSGLGIAASSSPAIGLLQSGARREFDVGQAVVETERAAVAAEQQLENDVRALESYNAAATDLNASVAGILNTATDQNLEPDPALWQRWFVDQLGYALVTSNDTPKPTVTQDVLLDYQLPPGNAFVKNFGMASCFAAGTLVHTLTGLQPIERLRAGDSVLVQDVRTGLLSYQAIIVAYHNPPNTTYAVTLDGGEAVVATGIHRFWKAGKGWAMARELKPGDMIRTLGGTARVASIESAGTQPVFNLLVGEGETFFAGKTGVLVHDNSLPSTVAEPFDTPSALVAATRENH